MTIRFDTKLQILKILLSIRNKLLTRNLLDIFMFFNSLLNTENITKLYFQHRDVKTYTISMREF